MRALVLTALLALPALADDTITVYARGEVTVRPDTMELRFRVAAKAEKAVDAVIKIGEKAGKVRDAMAEAAKERKIEAAPIRSDGLEFRNAVDPDEAGAIFGGGVAEPPPGDVLVETTIAMTVDGLDRMKDEEIADHVSAIVDGAIGAGAVYSGGFQWDWTGQRAVPASVIFRVKDPAAARAAAYEAAAQDARRKAAELAKSFGREVGTVARVEDIGSKPPSGVETPAVEPPARFEEWRRTGESTLAVDLKVEFRLK
ncbi:MAG: SIMPL domain-containing protein [Candidatus Brocadiae bacterium]|nr:SIMPL domain-containing protein [Candidatus Brocadiia bacterium]